MIAIMSKPILSVLRQMASRRRHLEKGQRLFSRGDPVSALYFVEAGAMGLVRYQEDGDMLILQRALAGSLLAEASLYAGHYHCDAVAIETATLTEIPRAGMAEALSSDAALAASWAAYLAEQVQAARLRAELLARKTVAARLDGWMGWHGGALPPKGEWKSLAAQIGVSPEALYRELSRRRLQK